MEMLAVILLNVINAAIHSTSQFSLQKHSHQMAYVLYVCINECILLSYITPPILLHMCHMAKSFVWSSTANLLNDKQVQLLNNNQRYEK